MVYACLGYGVMSFWLAFVVANKGSIAKKIKWIFGGWLMIWIINIIRITLLMITINEKSTMPFDLDNHTFFNIGAYIAIFVLIYFYDRSLKKDDKVIDAGY